LFSYSLVYNVLLTYFKSFSNIYIYLSDSSFYFYNSIFYIFKSKIY